MKFSNILLSVALTFSVAYSKSLNYDIIKRNASNGTTEHIEYKNFSYNFNCLEDNDGACDNMKRALNKVIDILGSTFEIYKPIVFDAYVVDLDKYGMKGVGGMDIDNKNVALKTSENEPPYVYPQALVKQLNLNKEIEFKENDFNILLNNKNYREDILLRLITHEIIHGLGFIEFHKIDYVSDDENMENIGLKNFVFNEKSDLNDAKILPRPIIKYDLEQINQSKTCGDVLKGSVIGFTPLSIFEKYIVDINSKEKVLEGLNNLYQEFNNCLKDKKLSNDKKKCYESVSPNSKKLMSEIPTKYYMKKDSIGFLTNDNTVVVPLQTFESEYGSGSSVCHSRIDYEAFMDAYDKYENNIKKDLKGEFNEKYKSLNCNNSVSEACNQLNEMLPSLDEEINNYAKTEEAKDLYWEKNISKYLDENFLMNFVTLQHFTSDYLLSTVGKNNRHGIIGNGIVDIFKTIGWTEKGQLKSDAIYYVVDDIDFPKPISVHQMFKQKELGCKIGAFASDATSIKSSIT